MRREEAIKRLQRMKKILSIPNSDAARTIEAVDIAIEVLKQVTGKLNNPDDSLLTADSEACKEQKSKLDLISRAEAIEAVRLESAKRGLLGRGDILDILSALPSADRPSDEEDQLKFYYVESIDDYWIGMRIDNFYYADWHEGLGFVWSHSKHLPWGEHIVDENTLWKEHTYPSEPIEIPFTKWIVGFVKKYSAETDIVRCGECKWADWYKTADGEQFCYCMETGNGGRTADDFCSYGERRGE